MAKAESTMLDTGDHFPSILLHTVEHGQVRIDHNFYKAYGLLLIYRGHW